jgi:hypothetical protein
VRSRDLSGLAVMAAATVALFALIGIYAPTVLAAIVIIGIGGLILLGVSCSIVLAVRGFVRARLVTREAERETRRAAQAGARSIKSGGGFRG